MFVSKTSWILLLVVATTRTQAWAPTTTTSNRVSQPLRPAARTHSAVSSSPTALQFSPFPLHGEGPLVSSASSVERLLNQHASLFVAQETESWRQYVPLVVSLLVIVDILLGSPAANAALSLIRPKEDEGGLYASSSDGGTPRDDDPTTNSKNPIQSLLNTAESLTSTTSRDLRTMKDPKERIDTAAVAQQALDKAAATTELRQFLDDNKTDWDKMREIQQKMDEDLAKFDQAQKLRQETEDDKTKE